jgi:hypothetical protein
MDPHLFHLVLSEDRGLAENVLGRRQVAHVVERRRDVQHEALAGRYRQGLGDPLAVGRDPGRVSRHVGVGGVRRVGEGAHDVEQQLLVLAIEIAALRHAPFGKLRSAAERRDPYNTGL